MEERWRVWIERSRERTSDLEARLQQLHSFEENKVRSMFVCQILKYETTVVDCHPFCSV